VQSHDCSSIRGRDAVDEFRRENWLLLRFLPPAKLLQDGRQSRGAWIPLFIAFIVSIEDKFFAWNEVLLFKAQDLFQAEPGTVGDLEEGAEVPGATEDELEFIRGVDSRKLFLDSRVLYIPSYRIFGNHSHPCAPVEKTGDVLKLNLYGLRRSPTPAPVIFIFIDNFRGDFGEAKPQGIIFFYPGPKSLAMLAIPSKAAGLDVRLAGGKVIVERFAERNIFFLNSKLSVNFFQTYLSRPALGEGFVGSDRLSDPGRTGPVGDRVDGLPGPVCSGSNFNHSGGF